MQPYPGPGGRQQVSTQGGAQPAWAHNGRELFYTDEAGRLLVAPVLPPMMGGSFSFGPVTTVLDTRYYQAVPTRNYDISKDGKRFLMIKNVALPGPQTPAVQAGPSIVVVLNWIQELQQRVPTR